MVNFDDARRKIANSLEKAKKEIFQKQAEANIKVFFEGIICDEHGKSPIFLSLIGEELKYDTCCQELTLKTKAALKERNNGKSL